MDKSTQCRLAAAFLKRHHAAPPLLLPNVWDPISARIFIAAGFDMLATTSGGVAWALGYPDGESAPWAEVVAATRRIVRVAKTVVSADIESGYGAGAQDVEDHVSEIIDAGVVGINIEDSGKGVLRSIQESVERVKAAREASRKSNVPIVINARCDVFHLRKDHPDALFDEAVERCQAYVAAGADCLYPFGLRDPAVMERLVRATSAPVNVTGRAGTPDLAALQKTGVSRVSLATAPALVAMSATADLARQLRASPGFDALHADFSRQDAQALFVEEVRK